MGFCSISNVSPAPSSFNFKRRDEILNQLKNCEVWYSSCCLIAYLHWHFLAFGLQYCLGSDDWFLPVKTKNQGHGACKFRIYMDDIMAAIETVNGDSHEGTAELGFENSKKRKSEALMQQPSSFVFAPPETAEETFIGRENELTPSLSTLQDMVPEEGESRDLIMEKALQVSSLSSSSAIRHRQAEFLRQISDAGDTSIAGAFLYLYSSCFQYLAFSFYLTNYLLFFINKKINHLRVKDPISQFLGLHMMGWLGRLAFPPTGCLTDPPSRPFFCCEYDIAVHVIFYVLFSLGLWFSPPFMFSIGIFPTFNPIFVPKETAVIHSEGLTDRPNNPSTAESNSSQQNLSSDAWCSSGLLLEFPSLSLNSLGSMQQGTDGDGQDLEALRQLLLLCQNRLLTSLESMNLADIQTVRPAFEQHRGAVSHLFAGHASFSERVRKFIACASLLAEIEKSINMDTSTQELMEKYQAEKLRYDNLCLSHAQTVNAIAVSDQQLEWLRGEALRLKEMLAKIENQVNDGEVENRKLKRRASEMSEHMSECEKKLKGSCKEVEAAKKAAEEREAARSAAKAELEDARIQLRP